MSYFDRIFEKPLSSLRSRTSPAERKKLSISHDGHSSGGGGPEEERQPDHERSERQLCAGFDAILEELKRDPETLEKRIERLKALPDCDGILGKLDQHFTADHWEMAAVLQEYDAKTFEHSLRVAKSAFDMASGGGQTEAYLKNHPKMHGVSPKELFAAALFHDIGKTAIPSVILHDNHSRREWAKRANEWAAKNDHNHHFDPEKLETLGNVELDHYFMELYALDKRLNPLDIVPIEEIFEPEILRQLELHGISPHDTFRKVLECHERATRAILRRKKMYTAADIASHHHDYERRPIRSERYPTETSAVRLGFELSLLRSMDVYDALTSDDRSYKNPYHPLLALEILIDEARIEFTERELTQYLVSDLYARLSANDRQPSTPQQIKAEQKILAFILPPSQTSPESS